MGFKSEEYGGQSIAFRLIWHESFLDIIRLVGRRIIMLGDIISYNNKTSFLSI
jgi:hypothetical protein